MWLNNNSISSNALWYGVSFSGSATTGTRTGNLTMHKTLPVQSQFRGCTVASDGTVKYLNATDWTKYEDGTARDTTLNTMVEIPAFAIKLIATSSTVEIRMSPYLLDGYYHFKKQYVSAYEAYNSGGVLKSIKGVTPTVYTTREQFQNLARANGSVHWNSYTYNIHKAITWCFVVEYANRNCQGTYNSALTSEGYRQGGLGAGVTTGVDVSGVYSWVPTGTTDSLGNSSGVVSYTGTSKTVAVPRYRGIENPYGHIWKNVCDVVVANATNNVYIDDDYTKFNTSSTLTDHKDSGLVICTSNGYLTSLVNNNDGDLFASSVGGTYSTYYCDYNYTNAISTPRTLVIGGHSDGGSGAGLFRLHSDHELGSSTVSVGSRVTYLI